MVRNLTIAIVMFISTLGPSLIIAIVGQAAVKALGRNPAAAPKILVALMFAFLFAEGIAVIALVMVYNLFK
jgi:F0F1-type ATP synthase membrane subunit c/vacuolar-type H+-ATPase subunit K